MSLSFMYFDIKILCGKLKRKHSKDMLIIFIKVGQAFIFQSVYDLNILKNFIGIFTASLATIETEAARLI